MKSASVWLRLPLPDGEVDVVLTRRPRKSVGIRVGAGRVELVAHPAVSAARLREVLLERRDWIAGHVARQRLERRQAEDLSQLRWRGEALPIVLTAGARRTARQTADGLIVTGIAHGDAAALKQAVRRFFKREAALRFPARMAELARGCRRQPCGLQLSSARTRWGSCTAAGIIRLNWRLLQAPPTVLDYVIAHELAHLEHMNHSPAFWAETARLYPGWQAARRWLKLRGAELFHFD
ncbi:M48 family metallopeptidase [Chromobacterium haemolyticum]|uniref:M48 family metallopeptidase n=1 Tax=Chromobacterium haemolyticum TaxID=394935 RepID=UPI0013177869|nr:SprT family zinc-dependent metalloprotease [Chromobacterium haemolyticum]BBH11660.1 zinc metalloprotease [Chromobacterium haemolyticum]